eukprot:g14107.t1
MGANVRLSPRHRILVLDGAHGFQFMPGACHHLTANAFEHWAAHPQPRVTLSWVRIPLQWQSDCLRFIGQHCRNAYGLESNSMSRNAGFDTVTGLAKYCPRLQHLVMSFRPDVLSERILFEVRTLACLGRRLLTLDLGAVAVRIFGGSCTIAACCPRLQRLSVQLYQFQADAADPSDIAQGFLLRPAGQDMDLAPVDWDDSILEGFMTQVPHLQRLVLRHVAPHATATLLMPLVAFSSQVSTTSGLLHLHVALHARSDPARATSWLQAISNLHLQSLCLDYAAPLTLEEVISSLRVGHPEGSLRALASLTIHGCHKVDDEALERLAGLSTPMP